MSLTTFVGSQNSDSYVSLEEASNYTNGRQGIDFWQELSYVDRERLLRQAAIDIDLFRFKGTKFFTGSQISPTTTVITVEEFIGNYFQNLQFPRNWHEFFSGFASGGTESTLTLDEFIDLPYGTNYCKYGTVYIVSGEGEGSISTITSFDATLGEFTVTPNFSSAPNNTSLCLLLAPIANEIKYAQIEQAIFNARNEVDSERLDKEKDILSKRIGDVSITYAARSPSSDSLYGSIGSTAFRFLSRFIDRTTRTGRV